MKIDDLELQILRKIKRFSDLNQRRLSKEIGVSLGKINYCLKELRKRGLIKIENFKRNNNKLNYVYIITPKGLKHKTKAILNFMKIKSKEYEELKKDLDS